MKRAVCGLLLLVLTGCGSVSGEPDDMELVQVLGIDGPGPIMLTAVSGPGGEVCKTNCLGKDFAEAREEIRWSGRGTALSLTGVSGIVVGAEVDLSAVLFSVLADNELGPSVMVWVTGGSAADLLAECEDPMADLSLLILKGTVSPTAAQALAAVLTDGMVRLPNLVEEDGRLVEQGSMTWRED